MSTPKPKRAVTAAPGRSKIGTLDEAIVAAHEEVKAALLTPTPVTATDVSLLSPYVFSTMAVPGYSTLDAAHLREIKALIAKIRTYANDKSRRRPLNILLHAAPGSGKSHFVECLARRLSDDRIKDVAFNMTSMRSIDDLAAPIDRVRDLKVADRLPLLFLDEFDSNPENYARLLPLLWDGKIDVEGRLLQTGKMIVVLAGSGKRIGELSCAAKSLKDATEKGDGKLVDLLSRINGGEVSIPSLDEVSPTRDRRVDKVCLSVALIRQRFGSSLHRVPWALLRFIADTKFRHGSRSVATLLELVPSTCVKAAELQLGDTCLPLDSVDTLTASSLIYHLAESSAAGVVERWKKLSKSSALVEIAADENFLSRLLDHMRNEPFIKRAIDP